MSVSNAVFFLLDSLNMKKGFNSQLQYFSKPQVA